MLEEFSDKSGRLFPLLVLSLPRDPVLPSEDESLWVNREAFEDVSWSLQILELLGQELKADTESLISAYTPILTSKTLSRERELDVQGAFLHKADLSKAESYVFLCTLVAYLSLNRLYDARGRMLCLNLAQAFAINRHDFLHLERKLYQYFLAHAMELAQLAAEVDKKRSKRAKYIRYAKIGAVSLGAGAVIAVTGGLAAPAIAAAFLLMGTATTAAAAAAATATTVACLFGGTAAGLSGYKMLKRTRGVTEFEFEQHGGEHMPAVVVLVSGWQKQPEDYKRAAGVVPADMTIKERLSRYYACHCPERLARVNVDMVSYMRSPELQDVWFNELSRLYGFDPRDNDSLRPGSAHTAQLTTSSAAQRHVQRFLLDFAHKTAAAKDASSSSNSASAGAEETVSNGEDGGEADVEEDGSSSNDRAPAVVEEALSTLTVTDSSELVTSGTSDRSSNAGVSDITAAEEAAIAEDCYSWHWTSLAESQACSLYLLRWETALQIELGGSIVSLLRNITASAVQDVLAYTVLTTLATAAFWPVLLIQLTSVIDNLWTIAIERADLAGQELARALLQREQGARPVTLIGYSLGARVIYSCLRTLAKELAVQQKQQQQQKQQSENAQNSNSSDGTDSKRSVDMMTFRVEDLEDETDSVQANSSTAAAITADGEGDSAASNSNNYNSSSNSGGGMWGMMKRSASAVSRTASAAGSTVTGRRNSNSGSSNTTGASTSTAGGTSNASASASEGEQASSAVASPVALRGLIEHVVLLGAPVQTSSKVWQIARRELVTGRMVNGYSEKDLVMGLLYRYQRWQVSGVAGITPVPTEYGVENIDLGSIVEQHTDYSRKLPQILAMVDIFQLRPPKTPPASDS